MHGRGGATPQALERLWACDVMNKMPVDIKEICAIGLRFDDDRPISYRKAFFSWLLPIVASRTPFRFFCFRKEMQ